MSNGEDGLLLILLFICFFAVVVAYLVREKGTGPSQRRDESLAKPEIRTKDSLKADEAFKAAKVEHVIDGDTVVLSTFLQKIRIRLDSIDCPENGQSWGDNAKYGLIKLIGGKKVKYEDHGVDSYGRTLATLYVFDQKSGKLLNVNERMVTLGHAWVMRRFYNHLPKDRQNKLNQLERWAKSKKVGLWKQPNPIPPWQHRNEQTKT